MDNGFLQNVGVGANVTTTRTLPETVGGLINGFLGLLGIIFIVLLIYGGFKYMTAQGESDNIKTATGIIRDALIGLVIILLAWSITLFVTSKIVGAT